MIKRLLMFIGVFSIIIGCNNEDNNNGETSNNDVIPMDFNYINLSTSNSHTNATSNSSNPKKIASYNDFINFTTFSKEDINLYDRSDYSFYYGETTKLKLDEILNDFGIQILSPISFIIFHNKSETSDLYKENIPFISVLWYDENNLQLRHTLLKKINNNYHTESLYETSTNLGILPSYINLLGKSLSIDINSSFLVYQQGNNHSVNSVNANYSFNQAVLENSNMGLSGSGCTISVCKLDLSTLNCGILPEGGLDCGVPGSGGPGAVICASESIANLSSTDISVEIREARQFRDDFLKESNKGREYIKYYNFVSLCLRDFEIIKLSNVMDFCQTFLKLNNLGKKLKSNETDSSEILISESDYIFYKNFINNNLYGVTKNKEYNKILDTVLADLEKYKLKSKSFIINDIR